MLLREILLRGRPLLQYSAATTAVTIDGDSIPAGSYATGGVARVNSNISNLPPINGQFGIANVAIGGQDVRAMTSNHADLDAQWQAGKTNVLIAWETINNVIHGRTGAQTFADWGAYITAVRSVHPWKVVICTGTPRFQDFSAFGQFNVATGNAEIRNCNALLRTGYKSIGADALADIAALGGRFDFPDFVTQSYYANSGLYNAFDGSDANGTIYVHLSDEGFGVVSPIIAAALARVRK